MRFSLFDWIHGFTDYAALIQSEVNCKAVPNVLRFRRAGASLRRDVDIRPISTDYDVFVASLG